MVALAGRDKLLLQAIGALEVDIDGEEVLVGLTASESAFVLSYPIPSGPDGTVAETLLCLHLRQRHLCARLNRIGR
jgi:hypothetical protein